MVTIWYIWILLLNTWHKHYLGFISCFFYNIEHNYIDFLQDHYELIVFIEYVGRIPKNTASKEVVAHHISYKSIMGQWIRDNDALCHTADTSGTYKATLCNWIIDTEGIPFWKKSVVIRSIYRLKNPSNRARCPTTHGKKVQEEQELILPDDSTSSSESDTDKSY